MAVETLAIHSTAVGHDSAANYYHTNSNHFLWLKSVNSPTICSFDRVLHLFPTISFDKLDPLQSNASLRRHYYSGSSYFEQTVSTFFDLIPPSVHCDCDCDWRYIDCYYYYLRLLLIEYQCHAVWLHPVHLNRLLVFLIESLAVMPCVMVLYDENRAMIAFVSMLKKNK